MYTLKHALHDATTDVDILITGNDSIDKGLAIVQAVESGVCLSGYDLTNSELSGANFAHTDFRAARFAGSNMKGVTLTGADISFADFTGANLERAILIDSNSRYCCFDDTNLSEANISWSSITQSTYEGANIDGVVMESVFGANSYFKCMQIDVYAVTYTKDFLQVQCQGHPIDVWKSMTARDQIECGYKIGYRWFQDNSEWLFNTMERYPAK